MPHRKQDPERVSNFDSCCVDAIAGESMQLRGTSTAKGGCRSAKPPELRADVWTKVLTNRWLTQNPKAPCIYVYIYIYIHIYIYVYITL